VHIIGEDPIRSMFNEMKKDIEKNPLFDEIKKDIEKNQNSLDKKGSKSQEEYDLPISIRILNLDNT
jgi:hypothetical protein